MTTAIELWKERVHSHHAQTRRFSEGSTNVDMWSGLADSFRDDPRRTKDPIVNLAREWLRPESTVLDVGGGAGRYALPFALAARQVTVVEPSPAMVKALQDSAREAGIENVSAVEETWEEATVEPHDVVFCANVVYGVEEIGPFLRKLDEAAKEIVAVVVFMKAPPGMLTPLWNAVHEEPRIDLPALPELLPVLWEMDLYPNVTMMPEPPQRRAPNMDVALAMARSLLWIEAGSEKDARLREAAEKLADVTDEGVSLRRGGSRPGVVWWRKGSG
jgi:SAM-dependent methyltransferase